MFTKWIFTGPKSHIREFCPLYYIVSFIYFQDTYDGNISFLDLPKSSCNIMQNIQCFSIGLVTKTYKLTLVGYTGTQGN